MPPADRLSIAKVSARPTATDYGSLPIRFGASDAVELVAVHYTFEIQGQGDSFVGLALSQNPDHEADPPGEIAAYFSDNALYGRGAWTGQTDGASGHTMAHLIATQVIPLYNLIVPSRQIWVWCLINSGLVTGLVAEVYFYERKLGRAEAAELNLRRGKYRR